MTKQEIQERIGKILYEIRMVELDYQADCKTLDDLDDVYHKSEQNFLSLISDVVKEVVICKPEKQLERLKELTQ